MAAKGNGVLKNELADIALTSNIVPATLATANKRQANQNQRSKNPHFIRADWPLTLENNAQIYVVFNGIHGVIRKVKGEKSGHRRSGCLPWIRDWFGRCLDSFIDSRVGGGVA